MLLCCCCAPSTVIVHVMSLSQKKVHKNNALKKIAPPPPKKYAKKESPPPPTTIGREICVIWFKFKLQLTNTLSALYAAYFAMCAWRSEIHVKPSNKTVIVCCIMAHIRCLKGVFVNYLFVVHCLF